MPENPSRPHRHASRLSVLLPALLFVLSASAQNMYDEASVDWTDRNGTRIWLHAGKPLQGPCKIGYMDSELAARYSLANYRDGVRSDTVSYYRASSHTLLFTVIRLGEKKRRIYEYNLSVGSFMRDNGPRSTDGGKAPARSSTSKGNLVARRSTRQESPTG